MRYFKTLLVLSVAVLVVGCAGMHRPEMEEDMYKNASLGWAVAYHCHQTGAMLAEDSATIKNMIIRRTQQYTFDANRLNQMARNVDRNYALAQCKEAEVAASQYRQMNQQQSVVQQSQSVPQYQYSQPARTICNNIAGQILCSTY